MKVLEQLDNLIEVLNKQYKSKPLAEEFGDIRNQVNSIIIFNKRLNGALQTLEENSLKQIDILNCRIQQLELIIKTYEEINK